MFEWLMADAELPRLLLVLIAVCCGFAAYALSRKSE